MRKIIISVAAFAALSVAGAASAQTFTPNPGSGTVSGSLSLQQTLAVPITCTLPVIPVVTTSSSTAQTAFTSLPSPICGFPYAAITTTNQWQFTATSSTQISILIPAHVNALGGKCGAGSVTAILDPSLAAQTFRIAQQSIPGVDSNNNPKECKISGVVRLQGIVLS